MKKINTVPLPKTLDERGGETLLSLFYLCRDHSFFSAANAFSDTVDRLIGLALAPFDETDGRKELFTPLTEGNGSEVPAVAKTPRPNIFMIKKDRDMKKGAFIVDVDRDCTVIAGDREGLWGAFSFILQTLERTCDKYIRLPRCRAENAPDHAFRALMVDVARKFHPVDCLFRYVDAAALCGIDRLVIHFTDDESFTLPSSAFPDLPTKGRCYSRASLLALGEYAADRGVMIVPEVDMPGHSARFNLKYPDVFGSCGIIDASDAAFEGLKKIICEVSELFPLSEFIHIGGDEAVLGRWLDSKPTLEYMEKNGVGDVTELCARYVGQMADLVLSFGKTPIVWEGFNEKYNALVPKETLVISWESHYQIAPKLVEGGFHILNASWKPLYVLAPWQMWKPEEILSNWDTCKWDHWWEGSAAYKEPITVAKDAPVEGAMLCAWGDYLKNYESPRLASQLEFRSVVPRLPVLSEKTWNRDTLHTPSTLKDATENFIKRLEAILRENSFRGYF